LKNLLVNKRVLRQIVLSGLVALMAVALMSGAAQAQSTSRKLRVGDTVNGTLDARTFAQVYTFDATKSDSITINATSKTRGLLLALVLSDAAGQTISQVAEVTSASAIIRDFKPTEDGTFYVTVLRATGVQGNTASTFTLSLTGTAATANVNTVTLTDNMSIALTWSSTDDMTLEVRDPVGGAANINTPTIASGGRLSGHVNAGCTNTTANNPTETVTWPKGNVPAGSYEILAYFNKSCPQGISPLTFTITVTVDGKAQDPIRGSLSAQGQVYVGSFLLSTPDQVTLQPNGANLSIDLSSFATKLASPTALATNNQATGTIDHTNAADVYSFAGRANQVVSVSLNATSGSLDAYLLLLDSNDNVIDSNDDANTSSRNSLIANRVLPADGTYKIVATRFAQALGGTEGGYILKLTFGRVAGTSATAAPTASGTQPAVILTQSAVPAGGATAVGTSVLGAGLPSGSIEAHLSWSSRADLRLWIRDPKGRAVYTDVPSIDGGGRFVRSDNLACRTTTTTPQDYIYWNSATPPVGTYEVKVWENGNCADTTDVTYTLTINVRNAAGAITKVIDYSGTPAASRQVYLTTFTVDSNGNSTAGAGDVIVSPNVFTKDISGQLASAPVIAYNQTVTGQITDTTKYVVYAFSAKAGDKIRITMRRSQNNNGGNLDPELFLMGGSNGGSQLDFNDDAGDPALGATDARINHTMTADGTYIIVATHYGVDIGGTTGNFTLQLTGPTH